MNLDTMSLTKISDNNLSDINGGNLGNVLKFHRKKRNFSEKELAKILHISATTLSHYENNHRRPNLEFIRDFSEIMHVDIEEFFKDL